MMVSLQFLRAGPLTSVQDIGRFGQLAYGVSASGPMDHGSFAQAAALLGGASAAGIETTASGLSFVVVGGDMRMAVAGGSFKATVNGKAIEWPGAVSLVAGDVIDIGPAVAGNYGYLRFDRHLALPSVLGSCATNSRAGIGGLDGRALRAGDRVDFERQDVSDPGHLQTQAQPGPIRFIWGLHADLFSLGVRAAFLSSEFAITGRMDRMGVRLDDRNEVFGDRPSLTLVSDAAVVGDVQILGDGTPIVLMRDHQPTGGYPRIGTIISADIDRFAQMRPGQTVCFKPISMQHAQAALRE